jgi:hypothetical protein
MPGQACAETMQMDAPLTKKPSDSPINAVSAVKEELAVLRGQNDGRSQTDID